MKKTDVSIHTTHLVVYTFQNEKEQNITINFELSDKSSSPIRFYESKLKTSSSNYKQYNVDAEMKLKVK